MIITIDGPVATGKSSIAKELARELGYIYFDTGAMYRCLTYGILLHHVNPDSIEELSKFLEHFSFDVRVKHGEKRYFFEKEDVTDKIRNADVTKHVSKISAIKTIRDKLVALQRRFAIGVNAVFEGRDMGTVVFPAADIKIFLTGRPDVRAKRRFDELKAKYPNDTINLTVEETLKEITDRDAYDTAREFSPLRQAADAIIIDTSDLTIADIIFHILEYKDTLKTRLKPEIKPQ